MQHLKLNRNILRFVLCLFVVSTASSFAAGTNDARDPKSERIVHFPDSTSLGSLFVLPPEHSIIPKNWWRNSRPARGTISVPKNANLALRVDYDAIQDPSLLTANGPDCFVTLDCSRVEADDKTVAKLSELTGLRALDLRQTDVSDQGLKPLSRLRNLEFLLLDQAVITDRGLSSLLPLPSLKTLSVNQTAISFKGVTSIQQCKQLESVSARGCRITDEGLASFSHLPELRSLDLTSNPKVTANGLLQLSASKKLKFLDLENTAINAKDLPVIQKLKQAIPSLRRVVLCDASFTKEKAQEWQHALPRMQLLISQDNAGAKQDARVIFAPLHSWSDR